MKKILFLTLVVMTAITVSAQEKTSSHSKWKEKKDGVTYEMEVKITGVNTKNVEKPHILFSTKGDAKDLTKIALVKGDDFLITVPVDESPRNINVAPGKYVMKFYHQKLGEQVMDVELKRGDDKQIVLTVR